MTEQQFNQIPFRMLSHLAMEHEHASTYVNEEYGFSVCKHVKKKYDFTFGRTYIHYMYRKGLFKDKNKEAKPWDNTGKFVHSSWLAQFRPNNFDFMSGLDDLVKGIKEFIEESEKE